MIILNKTVKLDIETEYPIELEKKEKQKMNPVEFEFWRSVRRMHTAHYHDAIACCKEVLQHNKKHYPAIFLIAILYQRTRRYDLSTQWFSIALSLSKEHEDEINFGLALSFYYGAQERLAYPYLENIVDKNLTLPKEEMYEKRKYIYLCALCKRKARLFNEAQRDYQHFIQLTSPRTFELLKKLMFTVVFKKLRNLES